MSSLEVGLVFPAGLAMYKDNSVDVDEAIIIATATRDERRGSLGPSVLRGKLMYRAECSRRLIDFICPALRQLEDGGSFSKVVRMWKAKRGPRRIRLIVRSGLTTTDANGKRRRRNGSSRSMETAAMCVGMSE
jgi:hypothetical protein